MQTHRILILEDDNLTISLLTKALYNLEKKLDLKNIDLAITVLSEYTQVEEYINKCEKDKFDVILLDRDCKACGSFHVLDIENLDTEKIISISSDPEWNRQAKERGVTKVVWKDFQNLDKFMVDVIRLIEDILNLKNN